MSTFDYVNNLESIKADAVPAPTALPWWLGPLALGGLYLALLFTACAVSAADEAGA